MHDDLETVTAYHEAGHAVVARLLGGIVQSVTLEPVAADDGMVRYGDTRVAWEMRGISRRDHALREIKTALAGPLAESIYTGEEGDLTNLESHDDWRASVRHLQQLPGTAEQRLRLLTHAVRELDALLRCDTTWAAVAALTDELLAHATVEGELLEATLEFWL